MSEISIANQLTKLFEEKYREKLVLEKQIEALTNNKLHLSNQIESFKQTLSYLDPMFDFSEISKISDKFQARKHIFTQNITTLIAQALKMDRTYTDWKKFDEIVCNAVAIEFGSAKKIPHLVTDNHKIAIANGIRRLHKQGLIEYRKIAVHHKVKKRGILHTSEWRLKPLPYDKICHLSE